MAGFISHGCDGLLRPVQFAGLLAVDDHSLEGESVSELTPHLAIEFGIVQTRLQNPRRLAQRFVFAVASRRFKGRIHILDDALGIGEYHAVGGLFYNPGEQYEALQRLASLGEIMKDYDSSRH